MSEELKATDLQADQPGDQETDQQTGWQRTSPVAVVIFVGRFLRALLTQGLPALLPLVATFAAVDGLRWWWLVLALVPLAAIVCGWSILSYLRFQYRLDERLILVRQGILHHQRLTLDFDRVQNVSIDEPFYMRPLGLVVLHVDTVGSQSREVTLGGIHKELAEQLRSSILEVAGEEPAAPEDTAAAETVDEESTRTVPDRRAPRLLVERDTRQLVRYGLTASGLFWMAILFGFVAGLNNGEWFASFSQRTVEYLIRLVAEGQVLYLVGIAAAGVGAILMVPLLSIAGVLIRHYGYRLTREGDTFRRRSGLINRSEESLKQHKIQSVVWKQNIIARWLDIVTLKLESAQFGSEEQAAAAASGIPAGVLSSFLVPGLEPNEALDLTGELLPGCDVDELEYSRPHARRYIGRKVLLIFTAPILLPTLPLGIFLHWAFLLLIPMGYLAAFLLVRQSWLRWGYALRGDYGFVRTGFLGHSVTMFPLFKMQRVDLRQTPGQRRAGLGHLTLHLASGSLTIPHMRIGDAHRIRDLSLYEAESTERSWY